MAPSITGYTGTWTHGGSVTIAGNAFGSKSTAAPQFWDTVDNQSAYSGVSDGDTIPVGEAYPWKDYNWYDAVKMESSETQRSTNSTQMYKAVGQKGTLDYRTIPYTGKLYTSWWWKPSGDPNENTGLHASKFIRIADSSDWNYLQIAWSEMMSLVYIDPAHTGSGEYSYGISYFDWPGNVGAWNFHEVWVDSVSREYTIAVNGTVATSASWSDSAFSPSFETILRIGWDGNNSYTPSITTWMDDIYLDNSFARVILGDQNTWAACTVFEMQLPTSWSTNSIGITVNQGALGVAAYPYVVDPDGSVSAAGPQITFGESEPDPPTGTPVLSVR